MYPVEREEERVWVEDVEIREVRVAMEAPTEAIVGREGLVADGVGFATLEYSNTVLPSCCIRDVGIPPSEAKRSRQLPETVRGSSR